MIPTLTAFLKTMTGKVALGLGVATMSVGAAAAAGAEIPVLTPHDDATAAELAATAGPIGSSGDEETEESTEESTDESSEESTDDSSDEEIVTSTDDENDADAPDSDAADAKAPEDDDEESDVADVDEETDRTQNHGAVVSEFARSTEYGGCQKGQAVSAVARGIFDPTTDGFDRAAMDVYVETKCGDAAAEAADDDDGATEVPTEGDWKTLRDETKADWHEARGAWVDLCGDDDDADSEADAGIDDDAADDSDDEMSDGCRTLKAEAKEIHETGRSDWKAARDEAQAQRKTAREADAADDDTDVAESGETSDEKAEGESNGSGNGNGNGKSNGNGNGKSNGNGGSKGKGKNG